MADTVGQRIVAYAKAQKKPVGDGQCTRLAEEALKSVGAKSAIDFAPPGTTQKAFAKADYVWGDPVDDLQLVQPGDILQFHNFRSKTTIYDDQGRWRSYVFKVDHHTAIVEQNLKNGDVIVLQQNMEGVYGVDRRMIAVYSQSCVPDGLGTPGVTSACVISGTVKAYRPVVK